MVTGTVDLHEISRFHELVIYLRTDYNQPVIAVKSDELEWWGDVRLSDLEVISGKLDSLDRMSIEQWVSAHRDDIAEAWRRYRRGMASVSPRRDSRSDRAPTRRLAHWRTSPHPRDIRTIPGRIPHMGGMGRRQRR